jgi:hypothetical protein
MPSVLLVVRRQNSPVFSFPGGADAVVRVRVGVVEVEAKEEVSAFKDDDFVAVVFEREVGLWE